MIKRCIAVVLCWVLIVSFLLPFRKKAYADPFTASQIASTSYALMQNWGISFTAGSATATGMNEFMTNQVQDYVNSQGGSIADVFVGQIAVDAVGKLVVGQQMYNSVIGFVDWLKDKYNLSQLDITDLSKGSVYGMDLGEKYASTEIPEGGYGYVFDSYIASTITYPYSGYAGVSIYIAGVNKGRSFNDVNRAISYYLWQDQNGALWGTLQRVERQTGSISETNTRFTTGSVNVENKLSWSGSNYVEPTVLNPDKQWTGTIGGYSEPDTNLDQLLGNINQAVADNNLVVDGEVIDVPVPPGPVPTWTPVDDVIDGINQTGEILDGIGNDIGNISGHLDDIGDQIDDVTGALEGVQEGIQTQTGVISGAMDQAAQDVVDAIGEQTATLDQTLTDTAEGVQDIAEALQPGEIEPKKFDLRGIFPFCIPFDIHNLLQKFNAEPVAPHVQLPFVIESIGFSYMIDLDFSAFDPVAAALRTVEFIVFAIGLAWATSKVIKW